MFEALLAEDPFVDEEPEPPAGPEPHVTAILVAHDGAGWLPEALAAIAEQSRQPDHLVAVDTGSTDDTSALLTRAFGSGAVVTLPRDSGYGTAVNAGLAAAPVPTDDPRRRQWVWLLHDDCAPDPTALERLLDHARRNPSVGIVGPKAVDWAHSDRLVGIGLTTDRAGRRITDLEHFELDQGQHDQPRDVLALGTAGSLIRRDVWDALGGFDPRLPLLREDIDLGWRANLAGYRVVLVPAARVRHVRATLTGRRRRDALGDRRGRLRRHDRAHGLYVVLANSGRLRGGLLGLPGAILAALLRAVVQLATRRPRAAADELGAIGSLLAHPLALLSARRWRRRTKTRSAHAVGSLLVRTGSRIRASLAATTDVLAGSGVLATSGLPGDEEEIPGDDARLLRRLFIRPSVGLVVGLTIVGLIIERSLLQNGTLTGGRLLPVPAGSSDLWRSYAASWHPGAWGSTTPASPWEPIVAAVSFVFGGSPPLAITVLLLGAYPLAGLSAWWATRRTDLSTRMRVWAAVTYVMLPPLGGAVAGGRFDAVVAIIAAPLLLSAGARLLTTDPHPRGWNRPFAVGLGLAITSAFSPPVWVLAVLLLGGSALLLVVLGHDAGRASALRRAGAALVALGVPIALLFPYTSAVFGAPRQLLVGLGASGGVAGSTGGPVSGADLLLLHPGGPLQTPSWFAVPLLLAAGVGLVRKRHSRVAALGATVAFVSYALALVVARTGATHTGDGPYGWPGPILAFASLGLLVAALVAGRRARETYAAMPFGFRQPAGVLLALVTVALPFVAAGYLLVSGTDGPLHRAHRDALPAFVRSEAQRDAGQRLLSLKTQGDGLAPGTVGFTLTAVSGASFGDEDLISSGAARRLVQHAVADLTSNRGTDAAEVLSTFHVRYVALPAQDARGSGATEELAATLDAQPGLSRFAVPGPTLLWQVLVPSSRVQLLSGDLADAAQHPAPADQPLGRGPLLSDVTLTTQQNLAAGREGARTNVPAGTGTRLVVLADARNGGWRATLDGRPLPARTAWGWAQAFAVPAVGGELHVWHAAGGRDTALVAQSAVLVVVLVLAAPPVRRQGDPLDLTGDVEGGEEPEEAAAPQAQLVGSSGKASG